MSDKKKSARSTSTRVSKLLSDEERAAMKETFKERADALTENLVRDARVCQGRQGCLLLPERAEVQVEIRDVRFPRRCKPRRR